MDNTVSPDPSLADLTRWPAYWQALPNLFPSKASANHFMLTRKAELVRRGLLVETVKGHLVRKSGLDAALVELLEGVK